jgi:hypothetical protein
MTRSSRHLLLAAAGALALPAPALACAVCGGGNPANRAAFFIMTIVMSLLPLAMFVAAFLWLRSRLRARGGSEFVERDAPATSPRPALVRPPSRDPGEPHPPTVPAH